MPFHSIFYLIAVACILLSKSDESSTYLNSDLSIKALSLSPLSMLAVGLLQMNFMSCGIFFDAKFIKELIFS